MTVVALKAADQPAGRPPAALRSHDVNAWFGSNQVLADVSLAFDPYHVTALIGPSGCGKSTFLRALNRMHELVRSAGLSGTIELDGVDIYRGGLAVMEVRRRIGMVFQKPNPFPTMTIFDNVLSGTQLSGQAVADKRGLVEQSLQRAGLWDEVKNRLKTPGGALSGGQQQRLCIARALAVQPEVLLMDEPCSALDPSSTRRIEETINEISREVTVVIVTHNMQQAQRVSHRCAFFLADEGRPGHVVEAGPTAKLFDDPEDSRTMDYVHGRFG
jgi:phosphate transport system ATP-binding protein